MTNHHSSRNGTTVDTMVVHYTAGAGTARSTAAFMVRAGNSAHAIIDREGGIAEPVPLDRAAWHAGDHNKKRDRGSRFPTPNQLLDARDTGEHIPIGVVPYVRAGVNARSVGVELVNLGWSYADKPDAVKLRHRNPASRDDDWQPYTHAQIVTLRNFVAVAQKQTPTLRYVTGHEDVTHADTMGDDWTTPELERVIGAKLDPGPAFPWTAFLADLPLVRVMYDFARHGWVLA